MAWARQPGCPPLPNCPLEVMQPREQEYARLSEIYGIPSACVLLGMATPLARNYYGRRPWYSGIWLGFVLAPLLGYAGIQFRDFRRRLAAERDEILRHYISLHPEDFPPFEQKLLRDVFEPWKPIR